MTYAAVEHGRSLSKTIKILMTKARKSESQPGPNFVSTLYTDSFSKFLCIKFLRSDLALEHVNLAIVFCFGDKELEIPL